MPGPSLCSLLTPFVCMYGNQRGVEEGDLTSSSFGYKQRLAMPSRQTKCSTCLPRRRGSRKWVYFSGFVCWLQSLVNWAVDCQPSCHIKSRVIAKVGRSKWTNKDDKTTKRRQVHVALSPQFAYAYLPFEFTTALYIANICVLQILNFIFIPSKYTGTHSMSACRD